jgi:hypothetical protein
MRRWLENWLTRLLAAAYMAAWARAIAKLPHDELSCRTTNLPGVGGPGSGPAWHRPSQSINTKRQLAERTTYTVPLEHSERNNA